MKLKTNRDSCQAVHGIKNRNFSPENFMRKFAMLLTMIILSNPISLIFIGILNRLLLNPVCSFFICYPASPKYTEKYCFKFIVPLVKRYPVIVGGFIQGGRFSIISVISSVESDFKDKEFISTISKYSKFIKMALGVKYINYSGILPSQMNKANVMSDEELNGRSKLVSEVVYRSEMLIRDEKELPETTPVIILGGKGSVGSFVTKKFEDNSRDTYVVDIGDDLPQTLKNKPAILIDVARNGVLAKHAPNLWHGMVILNETYPEPPRRLIKKLTENNIEIFHIAGVKAKAIPKFPHAYAGGIPCCAMNPSKIIEPLIKPLN